MEVCVMGMIAQTEQVFANLQAVLAAAQADLSHVVKTTVFLADMSILQPWMAFMKPVLQATNPLGHAYKPRAYPVM